MFLDLSTACLMFFHDNDMYMCNSENASSLTSGVVVDSATNATSAKTAKAVDAAVSSAIISAAVESAGAVTGIASVVSGGTATITATGSTTSVDIVGTGGVNVKGNTNGEVELDAKDLSDGTQSVSKELENARFVQFVNFGTASVQNALTLLHFSDIHADSAALTRIMADRTKFGSLVNDVICTGDMVETIAGQISSWWNADVMTVVGNHDTAVTNGAWNTLSMADRDAYYIAPFESNWGITHTSGTSYYYKDYSTQKVRLIALDVVLYDDNSTSTEAAAQTAWLESLLSSAKTAGLHVLIAQHGTAQGAKTIPCSFTDKWMDTYDSPALSGQAGAMIPQVVVNAVASAISNGTKFIGYIAGHYHKDAIWDVTGDRSQLIYMVTCAAVNQNQWLGTSTQWRDNTLDAFNLVTIDTTNTRVKLVRGGGANIDLWERKREALTINYSTGEITDCEFARGVTDDAIGFRMENDNNKIAQRRYIATLMPTGSTVTLQAGYGYQFTATSEVILETEVQPSDSFGLESLLDITLSGGTVAAGNNVILTDTLTAGVRNICAVRYIDGIAVVNVLTVIGGIPADAYAVSVATGTDDGSLYYGLATSEKSDIYVSSTLDGQTLDMGGAVTNGSKTVHGNGFAQTVVSGGVSCASPATFTDLSLNNVTLNGGTMSLGNIEITGGGNVTAISGCIALGKVQGSGSIVLGGTDSEYPVVATNGAIVKNVTITGANNQCVYYADGVSANLSNVIISGNTRTTYVDEANLTYNQKGGYATVTGCTFSDNINTGSYGVGVHTWSGANAVFTDCVFTGNTAEKGAGFIANVIGATVTLNSCTFTNNNTFATNPHGPVQFLGSGGTGYINSCVISGTSVTSGGALFVDTSATVNVSNTTIAGASNGVMMATTGGIVNLTGSIVSGAVGYSVKEKQALLTGSAGPINMQGCTISGCTAAKILLEYGFSECAITDCVFTGNSDAGATWINFIVEQASATITGTTITNNVAGYEDLAATISAHVTLSNCLISGNVNSYGTAVGSASELILAGGNTIEKIAAYNAGTVIVSGSNNVGTIMQTNGNNYVRITSGASVTLANSIIMSAGHIVVSSGGCVVNGASIPAGTYTQIVSSGGSAVAS